MKFTITFERIHGTFRRPVKRMEYRIVTIRVSKQNFLLQPPQVYWVITAWSRDREHRPSLVVNQNYRPMDTLYEFLRRMRNAGWVAVR